MLRCIKESIKFNIFVFYLDKIKIRNRMSTKKQCLNASSSYY